MLGAYKPLVLSSRLSQYGYWVVTVSMAPGLRTEVMCAKLGLTSEDAEEAAILALPQVPSTRGSR